MFQPTTCFREPSPPHALRKMRFALFLHMGVQNGQVNYLLSTNVNEPLLCGRRGCTDILEKILLKQGKIAVVSDQFGNPTSANDLAYEILKIACTEEYGVYHCTNEGTCSWFDFANAIVDKADITCEREPLTTVEYKLRFPNAANRPAYSSLENKKLIETIGNEMRPWQEALETYVVNLPKLGD